MPYVERVKNGKVVDRFYTARMGEKKKARKEAGAGTNPGEQKKN